jgi:hypothetical protein
VGGGGGDGRWEFNEAGKLATRTVYHGNPDSGWRVESRMESAGVRSGGMRRQTRVLWAARVGDGSEDKGEAGRDERQRQARKVSR